MTATNHALTGALIGCAVGNPWLALPLAFASHFVCDAIPHFGSTAKADSWLRSRRFAIMLGVDAVLCIALVLLLAVAHPVHWFLAAICAFLATSPDLAWLPGYIRTNRGKRYLQTGRNAFMRFAATIQWFEKPIGGLVELAWLIGSVTLLVAYLR